MAKTLIRREIPDIKLAGGLPGLLERLYLSRGIARAEDLDLALKGLLPPTDLKGIRAAVEVLSRALDARQRILVVGDFDCDGATSSALMVSILRELSAEIEYLVPNRFEYGYGLTPEIVDVGLGFDPAVIVTVDNGISSIDGVRYAKDLGIAVVVTDHHLPGEQLPVADAIVNPNQPDCPFSSKNLAGVGVAFYLLSALRASLRRRGWFEATGRQEPNLVDRLDLVALGTVADVVPLDHNNRILVQEGLRRIRAGRALPGINALISAAGKDPRFLNSTDMAYGLAPRLNAAGRLEDMSLGINCLLEAVPERARAIAGRLDELNRSRREIESDMKAQAEASLEKVKSVDALAVGLALYEPEWHQGVVGIVASRIKDRYHRPVFAFAPGDAGNLKGSGRSIEGLHIRDALDAIAARYQGLVIKFGGHAMAAGLSIREVDFPAFRDAFDEEVRRWLTLEDLEATILSDGEIAERVDVGLARQVLEGGPWGQGFPAPVFDGSFEILSQKIVGGGHLKLKARNTKSDQVFEAIAFGTDRLIENRHCVLVYRLDLNLYDGLMSVQLIVDAIDPQRGRT
ncbi:MAG: single-stranded-DNA-specific exonuclease RecJ [Gammaproteobacteria bacterium]|nr:single-stranded-DNA-specific exonuclease RecJ [Gammaproteobacteria bacterium]